MTLTDKLKILDDKIKANQTQYNLDREADTISTLSPKELDKYEYLTDEALGYKPGVAEQVKFEYFPLSKVFNKGLKKDDKVDKVNKYNNHLAYSFVQICNKYSVSNFNEILTIDFKFATINKFCEDFKTLDAVKSQSKETK